MKKDKGFTLVEVLVVLAILGILFSIGTLQFGKMVQSSNIEKDIKELYSDLMSARINAMNKGRNYFLVLTNNNYKIYEDNYPAPDGNGTFDSSNDTLFLNKTLSNQIVHSLALNAPQLVFNKNGSISNNGNIRIENNLSPEHDCIILTPTRINLGKWDGNNCVSK